MQVTRVSAPNFNNTKNSFGHAPKEEKSNVAATGLLTAASATGSGYAFSYGLPDAITNLGTAIKGISLGSLWSPFTAAVGLGAVAAYGAYSLVRNVLQK